jgi:hypothetical protein
MLAAFATAFAETCFPGTSSEATPPFARVTVLQVHKLSNIIQIVGLELRELVILHLLMSVFRV